MPPITHRKIAIELEVDPHMQTRTALSAALAIGLVVTPAAFAQHGTSHGSFHGRSHATTTATNTRTIHVYGIITGAATGTGVLVTPLRHHHHGGSTTPITVMLDTNTTFSTLANSTASWSALTLGDKVKITWTVPDGTNPSTVPATSVADLGTPPPLRTVVSGITTGPGTSGGVTITVVTHTRHHGHAHQRGTMTNTPTSSTVNVTFDSHTVFAKKGVVSPTWVDIASGDKLKIVWMAPPNTPLGSMPPAAKVIDLGTPPPTRYRAEGAATTTGSSTGVTMTVNEIHPNAAPGLPSGASLNVTFDLTTVFTEVGNPSATLASILPGDRLLVIWTAPPGTPATSLPNAARIVDFGQSTGHSKH